MVSGTSDDLGWFVSGGRYRPLHGQGGSANQAGFACLAAQLFNEFGRSSLLSFEMNSDAWNCLALRDKPEKNGALARCHLMTIYNLYHKLLVSSDFGLLSGSIP